MQLVTQIQFSVSMLAKGMFTVTEYSIYGQNSEKTDVSRPTRADCTNMYVHSCGFPPLHDRPYILCCTLLMRKDSVLCTSYDLDLWPGQYAHESINLILVGLPMQVKTVFPN